MTARLRRLFRQLRSLVAAIRQCAARRGGCRLHRRLLSGRARARGGACARAARPHRPSVRHGGAGGARCSGCVEARRIGLVSPYPPELDRASVAYWRSHGFEVCEVANVASQDAAFHPIYAMAGSSAVAALRSLEGKPLDAIVMLGTGMPTLAPIASAHRWNGAPVMSCNLCLAWRMVEMLDVRSRARRPCSPGCAATAGWLG